MTLSRIGGFAALTCAATYLFGFAVLVTVLAPLGFGTAQIDIPAVVAFIHESPGLIIVWNTTIYIVNALALVVLVVALAARLRPASEAWANVTQALGLIWATLVLAAGMTANVATERVLVTFASDPDGATELWAMLHSVELGLGGGNEIAGAAWILSVSVAGGAHRRLSRPVTSVGLAAGAGGFATLVPALGDTAGAVFGLGAILWFILIGIEMARTPDRNGTPSQIA